MKRAKSFPKAASFCSSTLAEGVFILEYKSQHNEKHAWEGKVCCNKSKEMEHSEGVTRSDEEECGGLEALTVDSPEQRREQKIEGEVENSVSCRVTLERLHHVSVSGCG